LPHHDIIAECRMDIEMARLLKKTAYDGQYRPARGLMIPARFQQLSHRALRPKSSHEAGADVHEDGHQPRHPGR
jgi:hypothetical protein